MSDDGQSAIVIIALLGNPFSPAYARAHERGSAKPLAFCSMNVALYARSGAAWSLTERSVTDVERTEKSVSIGRSAMAWDRDRLVVDVDERTAPFGRRVQGKVILHPEAETGLEMPIDARGEHRWWPVAPLARIDVDLPAPGVRFRGHGYHDANAGDAPLHAAFDSWDWSRARTEDGALITYDVVCASGAAKSLALKVSPRGDVEPLERLWSPPLPPTIWGLERRARVDEGQPARVVRSLEDGPFYARALVETRLGGRQVLAMHESLAARRLRHGWVRALTRFRMRTAG